MSISYDKRFHSLLFWFKLPLYYFCCHYSAWDSRFCRYALSRWCWNVLNIWLNTYALIPTSCTGKKLYSSLKTAGKHIVRDKNIAFLSYFTVVIKILNIKTCRWKWTGEVPWVSAVINISDCINSTDVFEAKSTEPQ